MLLNWLQVGLIAMALVASGAVACKLRALSKCTYLDLKCKGVYDVAMFARLDRICEDCYNLFRDPRIDLLCKRDCFTDPHFKACVEVLQETDQLELFKQYIKVLHGADIALN